MKPQLILNLAFIAIAAALALYYLLKQKRKDDRYFGKTVPFSKRETAILDKYRNQYQPVGKDARLPALKKDGYTLEDVTLTATKFIFDQPLPTAAQKLRLKPGDAVQLKFEIDDDVERMWVEIADIDRPLYKGILRNDAFEHEALKEGRELWFHDNHIYKLD